MSINPFERLNWINVCKETAACHKWHYARWRCHLVHFVPAINIWDFNSRLPAVCRSGWSRVARLARRKQHLEASGQMCGGLLHLVMRRTIRCEWNLEAEQAVALYICQPWISCSPESVFNILLVSHAVFTDVLHFESGPKTLFTSLFYWEATLLKLLTCVRPHI